MPAPSRRLAVVPALALAGLAGAVSAQTRLYVDASRPTDAGPGTTWGTAYKELRTALLAAPPSVVEIWVADGVYRPAPPAGSRDASFQLRSNLALYGGFAGGEALLSQREPTLNAAVLSGDLNGDDGAGGLADNSVSVVTATGVFATGVLDGFTVTRGLGSGTALGNGAGSPGGGMAITGGGPTVRRCRFVANSAGNATDPFCSGAGGNAQRGGAGGAVYAEDSAPSFSDCVFVGNAAGRGGRGAVCASGGAGGAGGEGGAVAVVQTIAGVPSPSFTNCVFLGNAAGDGGRGGATFNGNGSAAGAGGGGGAVAVIGASSPVRFVNCLFHANRAGAGGLGGTGDFGSGGNGGAGGSGGAVLVEGAGAHALLNCTIVANAAGPGGNGGTPVGVGIPGLPGAAGLRGGALFTGGLAVTNSIARDNTDRNGSAAALSQLGLSGGPATVRHSNVTGIDTSDPSLGNIDADPLFRDPDGADNARGTADDDLRLAPASSSADAGDNDAYRGPATDAGARPRAYDSVAAPDTGLGSGPIVDMGALEAGPACPGDFDANGTVSVIDLFAYLGAFFAGCP